MSSSMLKVTQLVRGGARIRVRVFGLQTLYVTVRGQHQ